MKKILAIVMISLAVVMVGCNGDNKIEKRFSEYAKTENIPNYKGISSVELTDSIPVDIAVSQIEFKIDSVKSLLKTKIQNLLAFYDGLSSAKKRQHQIEFARIGADYAELAVKDIGNNDPINILKDAVEELSPYKQPLYIYHIIAKVETQDVSYFAFVVGDDISFIKSDDESDAMRKNKKLHKVQEAAMNAVKKKSVLTIG